MVALSTSYIGCREIHNPDQIYLTDEICNVIFYVLDRGEPRMFIGKSMWWKWCLFECS